MSWRASCAPTAILSKVESRCSVLAHAKFRRPYDERMRTIIYKGVPQTRAVQIVYNTKYTK